MTSTYKLIDRRDPWWEYSWQINARNQTDRDIGFTFTIQFIDAEGFVLEETSGVRAFIKAGRDQTFKDTETVSCPACRSVVNIQPLVKYE